MASPGFILAPIKLGHDREFHVYSFKDVITRNFNAEFCHGGEGMSTNNICD